MSVAADRSDKLAGPAVPIGLSTASVYPQNTEAAFAYAADLGFDGVELMIWSDPVSQDIGRIEQLMDEYQMPVLSIHAPCLLISQRVWGRDQSAKLARSVDAAEDLGAGVVVVHPPFRWQRSYTAHFADLVAELEERSDVAVAVENMFPLRIVDRLFARRSARERAASGQGPGWHVSGYGTSIDPTDDGFAHYTLDLSHTATAGVDALALYDRMGDRLAHLHLADGDGSAVDEHLIPGDGSQPCEQVCRRLVERGFTGAAVLEVTTGGARDRRERSEILTRALSFARRNLAVAPR